MNSECRVVLGYLLKQGGRFVYRLDSSYIKDFSDELRQYHHNDDWSVSGRYDTDEEIPSGYQSDRGLFAARTLEEVAPYAIPRGVKWVRLGKTLYVDKSGESACHNYRPVLSVFDQSKFAEPVSGAREMFSRSPGIPVKRKAIMNPLQFIESQGLHVKFVDNIDKLHKSSVGKPDFMGADGNFEH